MKINRQHWCRFYLVATIFFLPPGLSAHDPGSLTDSNVDRTNDAVANIMHQVQMSLSEIFQSSQTETNWPVPELGRLQDQMLHLKEEADMSLEYLIGQGINIQSYNVLIQNPIAGRSVSASQAIDTAIALLKHTSSLDTGDDFRQEIYTGGLSAYMFDLLGAHLNKMALYGELMKRKQ